MQYDGHINIDTKVDTKGFGKGLEDISSIAQKGMGLAVKAIGAAGTGLAALGGYAVSVGAGFDTAMSQVAATMAIPKIIASLIDAIISNVPRMAMSGLELFVAIIKSLPTIIVTIVKAVPQIVNGIINAFKSFVPKFKEVGTNLIKGLWNGMLF